MYYAMDEKMLCSGAYVGVLILIQLWQLKDQKQQAKDDLDAAMALLGSHL